MSLAPFRATGMAELSKHERLAALLDRTGALEAALRARRALPVPSLGVVTFHRIAELAEDDPFDSGVLDATPTQFRHHVEALARFGTPIGIDAVVAALDGHSLPPNPFMITFDDGYKSCRDIALPILVELGVPATFFVSTDYPDSGRLYWWDQLSLFVRRARRRFGELSYPHALRLDAREPGVTRGLCDVVKNTFGLDLPRFLSEVRTAFDVEWSEDRERSLARGLVMSWDDVRTLAAAGMDVESHTRRHRVLETLERAELREELVGSRRDLEAMLGRPVRAISYPVGRLPPTRVRRAVAQAGYRIAFTNDGGVNRVWPRWLGSIDPFSLRRQSSECQQSDAMLLTQFAVPGLGF